MSESPAEYIASPDPLPTPPAIAPYPLWLLGVVLGIALCGDVLLREAPLRLNFALWVLALCWGGVGVTVFCSKGALPWGAKGAFSAAGCFGLMFMLRNANEVLFLALVALTASVLFGVAVAHGFRWTQAGLFEYLARLPNTLRIFNESGSRFRVNLSQGGIAGVRSQAGVLLRGIALAVPFLIVFGILFARADVRFFQILNLDMTFEDLLLHAVCFFFCALIAWILLTALYTRAEQRSPTEPLAVMPGLHYGSVEVCIAVGLILLLFGVFVVLQLPYLFGGAAYVQATDNLTAAAYARRGFFEMASAGALALASVYFLDWLTRDEGSRARRVLHVLIQGLLLLVAIVLASAAHRMYVYIHLFGLSEARLWTLVIMGGLAVLLLWTGLTVLRNRREQFASGAFVVALGCIGVYGLINPDALVAKVNAQRSLENKPFDLKYASLLSYDAVPELVALWESTTNQLLRKDLYKVLERKQEELPVSGWRSWNLGIHRAKAALKSVR